MFFLNPLCFFKLTQIILFAENMEFAATFVIASIPPFLLCIFVTYNQMIFYVVVIEEHSLHESNLKPITLSWRNTGDILVHIIGDIKGT